MSPKLLRLTFYLLVFTLIACKNNTTTDTTTPKEIDPLEAALPHGDTLPTNNLNEADREKLANAIGRTVDIISPNGLISDFKKKSNKLQIYAFWKLDCKTCAQQHQFLRKLQNEIGIENMELTFVNLDATNKLSEVNASIRAQSISESVYMVSDLIISELEPQFRNIFSAPPPTLLFIQNDYHTFEYFNRNFEYDELYAMVQPLLI